MKPKKKKKNQVNANNKNSNHKDWVLQGGKTLENTDTYSVLRFFNRLKEPGCKSLILLNLKSLETKKINILRSKKEVYVIAVSMVFYAHSFVMY